MICGPDFVGAGAGRSVFCCWAPQIALAALAALIVGIVWRENPRDEPASIADRASERASDSPIVETPPGEPSESARVDGLDAEPGANVREARPAPAEGVEGEQAAAPPASEARPAAPPPAEREEGFAADDLAKARDEDAVVHEAVPEAALGAAQRAVLLPSMDRFRLEAREALAARDTAAGRRALALWSDTLAPRGDTLDLRDTAGRPGALADSLRQLLGAPGPLGGPDTLPSATE